jgi:2-C-methyl-D-erythritol 2,4-cyclodiphosphate synthase
MSECRVGQGFDVHKLVEGRKFILGGVEIPYEKGFLAHSDGDVLIHAIIDAILGAMSARDIGFYFPDTLDETEGMSSIVMLKRIMNLLDNNGYLIVNLDSTIIVDKPKLSTYIESVRDNLSKLMNVDKKRISVKAKTTEGVLLVDDACVVLTNVLIKEK